MFGGDECPSVWITRSDRAPAWIEREPDLEGELVGFGSLVHTCADPRRPEPTECARCAVGEAP